MFCNKELVFGPCAIPWRAHSGAEAGTGALMGEKVTGK